MLDKQYCQKHIFKLAKNGFTLAEALVTLAIVGVVATIAIPTLQQNLQNYLLQAAYKKAYTIGSQAWTRAYSENKLQKVGVDDRSNSSAAYANNGQVFKSYFSIAKDCNNNNGYKCWEASGEKLWGTQPHNSDNAFIDNSGMVWVLVNGSGGNTDIYLDTNGDNGPNRFGRDRFDINVNTINPYEMPGFLSTQYCFEYATNIMSPNPVPPPCTPFFGIVKDTSNCISPPCYNTSWLYK